MIELFLADEAENFLKINCNIADDWWFRYYLVRSFNEAINKISVVFYFLKLLFTLSLSYGCRFTYSITLLSGWRGLLTSEEVVS